MILIDPVIITAYLKIKKTATAVPSVELSALMSALRCTNNYFRWLFTQFSIL